MEKQEADILGRYDELELIELGEADAHGGTGWACAITGSIISAASSGFCPTTKCTTKC